MVRESWFVNMECGKHGRPAVSVERQTAGTYRHGLRPVVVEGVLLRELDDDRTHLEDWPVRQGAHAMCVNVDVNDK